MPFSNAEANSILKWALGLTNTSLSSRAAVYIGLLANDPEEDNGTCNELTGDTYARVRISKYGDSDATFLVNPADRIIQNSKQINWTKATVAWPEVKGIALYTAASGSAAPFYYAKVPKPFTVQPGEVALFEPGNLKISMLATDVDIE